MRVVVRAEIVHVRRVLANDVHVVQAGAVEVNNGRARDIGGVDGGQALVVKAVRRIVLRGEDAPGQA